MARPSYPPRTTGMSFHHFHAVRAHSTTSGLARTILMCIADHCDEHNDSWPSMGLLAKEVNCTKRSVINALKKIPEDELKICHRGGSKQGDSNRYRLLIPVGAGWVKSTTGWVKSTTGLVKSTTGWVKSDSLELTGTITKETPIIPKGDKSQENENPDFNNPALLRIRKLFQTSENQLLDTATRRAWEKNGQAVENLSEEEWALLEWAHKQTQGEAYKFRYKSPKALIRNLCAAITHARSWKDKTPRERPAPDGWAEMIRAEFPEAQFTTWELLPDSMKAWVWEKDRERASLPMHHAFVADPAMP